MNNTPIADRIYISFFGKRNVGKSSLVNAILNQNLSIVSKEQGTTTDPVSKAMELLPLGPVVLTDTAGIDDIGGLGNLRIKKTYEILDKTDICIIVCDINDTEFEYEKVLLEKIKKSNKKYLIVVNKDDNNVGKFNGFTNENLIFVSAKNNLGIENLKNIIGSVKIKEDGSKLLDNIAEKNKIILLVTPIDGSAPKNRLIMPQVMAIRNVLDEKGLVMCVQPEQVPFALKKITPDIVITDSQAFKEVNKYVPENIKLTSFSILMARLKSNFDMLVKGAESIDDLCENDKILIAEACTHHAQKNDIGRVQIPKKLKEYTGKNLIIDYISGFSFPENLSEYKLIIHCGACMITKTMMKYRQELAQKSGVPMTNYGILLAKLNGILKRVTTF